MCLAVPSKIVELAGDMATVEIDGIRRTANVSFIQDAKEGDYVLLHAGFAIEKWSEDDVREWRTIIEGAAVDEPGEGG